MRGGVSVLRNVLEVLWYWTGKYRIVSILYKELHRYVRYRLPYSRYILTA